MDLIYMIYDFATRYDTMQVTRAVPLVKWSVRIEKGSFFL